LKNEKERKSCILENNFHVELLRPHREKAKREKKIQNKKRNKKEEVKGRKRQSDKPKIKTKRIIDLELNQKKKRSKRRRALEEEEEEEEEIWKKKKKKKRFGRKTDLVAPLFFVFPFFLLLVFLLLLFYRLIFFFRPEHPIQPKLVQPLRFAVLMVEPFSVFGLFF
jgi:hypothetical protein